LAASHPRVELLDQIVIETYVQTHGHRLAHSKGRHAHTGGRGIFGLFKNGVRGVYHAISTTYLQNYLDEYTWRYNHRHDAKPMFWSILDRVGPASSPS
jgi:hypothetical protein